MTTPLVTIGIPVYNCERFIRQAIESVLNQTYANFELIITDDGSTDKSVAIIKQFDDKRIRLVVDNENHGISYRLNQQIRLAKGEYFVRMDGDDVMMPYRIEKQVEYLSNHPEVDLVGSSAIIIDDDNNIIGIRRNNNCYRNIDDVYKYGLFIHPTVAGRMSWFLKWQYREDMTGVEDYDLWLRSYNSSKFYNEIAPLMYYRDPLRFKLSTYLFRTRRMIKCQIVNLYLANSSVNGLCCIFKQLMSAILAIILSGISCDKWMIARRNELLSNEDIIKYKMNSE
jgi:glycosyltransferase involved in cell wall biosynthesis